MSEDVQLLERQEASQAVAACPVCSRAFRPRGLSMAWESVLSHVAARSRQGCDPHGRLHAALHHRAGPRRRSRGAQAEAADQGPRRARFGCPGCEERFPTRAEACVHLATCLDASHAALHTEDRSWTAERATTAQARRGLEPLAPDQELYGYAKAGDLEGVQRMLAAGLDPNDGGEDGYTPLMTAAEAGHDQVVALLAGLPGCRLELQNSYGQTALSLASQEGRAGAVAALLAAGAAPEALCGAATAAELARAGGHSALADSLAADAQGAQLAALRGALAPSGAAGGVFDSTRQRILALFGAAGLAPPGAGEAEESDLMEWRPLCNVCMGADVDTALTPCFHAAFCESCAVFLQANPQDSPVPLCPLCRVEIAGIQRIYF